MTEQTFEVGQVFEGEYPPEAAEWCNNNGVYIEELDPVTKVVDGEEKTIRVFEIKEIPEPPAPTEEELAAQIRAKRDSLIAATDYLMASDYPIEEDKKAELVVYRQALRDVPEQEGFPTSVTWPEKPEWLK